VPIASPGAEDTCCRGAGPIGGARVARINSRMRGRNLEQLLARNSANRTASSKDELPDAFATPPA